MADDTRDPLEPAPASDGLRGRGHDAARDTSREGGRATVIGAMGALVLLGLALIVRGPRHDDAAGALGSQVGAPAAVLRSAVVGSGEAGGAAAAAKEGDGAGAGRLTPGAPHGTPPAKFVPAWRISTLKADPDVDIIEDTYGKRSLASALASHGFGKSELKRVQRAFEGVHGIDHPPANDKYVIAKKKGSIVGFEHIASPSEIWQAKLDESSSDRSLVAHKLDLFVERRPIATALAITTDLTKAVAAAGLRPEAIEAIDDALEGHVDLASIKPGVRLRVAGFEEWVEGVFTHLRIDAVELTPKKGNATRVYFYEHEGRPGRWGYWNTKGQQPFQGAFRSPVPFARITSRFNPRRMHPILHVVRPHNGVDFGASTGTPVYASAAGTVTVAGNGGACGNMVQIQHPNGLTTAYCHLSRFAAGLRAGQHVDSRQLVGYVGQTGRATGPHLHFAVKKGGKFIDPLAIKLDGVRVLPPPDREPFAKRRVELDAVLDGIALPAATDAPDDADDKDEPAGEE
jgi:murein DD-endopeptidase MepM/ murein hydrolase activator NlpD